MNHSHRFHDFKLREEILVVRSASLSRRFFRRIITFSYKHRVSTFGSDDGCAKHLIGFLLDGQQSGAVQAHLVP